MLALVAVVTLASGCVSGHLMAAGRRREYARTIHATTPVADGTIVRYTADVTDDDGNPIDTVERTVTVPATDAELTLRDLTRTWTAPWVYPMLPLAVAADAVAFPLLTALAPIVLLVGD
jgi:hypothetical protein